jgi:hypothetical protein
MGRGGPIGEGQHRERGGHERGRTDECIMHWVHTSKNNDMYMFGSANITHGKKDGW